MQVNVAKCNENQWILVLKGVWKRGGEGRKREEKVGPAECAMAAYFASRKQERILHSDISACASNTAEPARGWPYSIAPRIPPGLG